MYHIKKNKLISENQAGFIKGRQAMDHIINLDNDVKMWKEMGYRTAAVFLDMEKAYDVLWQKGLLLELRDKEISGNLFNYISHHGR